MGGPCKAENGIWGRPSQFRGKKLLPGVFGRPCAFPRPGQKDGLLFVNLTHFKGCRPTG